MICVSSLEYPHFLMTPSTHGIDENDPITIRLSWDLKPYSIIEDSKFSAIVDHYTFVY